MVATAKAVLKVSHQTTTLPQAARSTAARIAQN